MIINLLLFYVVSVLIEINSLYLYIKHHRLTFSYYYSSMVMIFFVTVFTADHWLVDVCVPSEGGWWKSVLYQKKVGGYSCYIWRRLLDLSITGIRRVVELCIISEGGSWSSVIWWLSFLHLKEGDGLLYNIWRRVVKICVISEWGWRTSVLNLKEDFRNLYYICRRVVDICVISEGGL